MSRWTKGPLAAAFSAVGLPAALTWVAGSQLPTRSRPPPPATGRGSPRSAPAGRPGADRRPPSRWLSRPVVPRLPSRAAPGATAVPGAVPATVRQRPAAAPTGPVVGQNPEPFTGAAAVRAADLQPGQRLDGRRGQADQHQLRAGRSPTSRWPRQAIHISSTPPVPGKFYWMTDSQVRWRPLASGRPTPSVQHRRGRHQVELPHR